MRKAASGVVYRKEDILKMSTMAVNPGWGKGGKNTYSIWLNKCELNTELYKGGGACKHKFQRVILVQKGKRAKGSDDRRRGFKPVPNKETEWAVKPTDMPNKGFINK